MPRPRLVAAFLFFTALLAPARVAVAQDTFEIQVYEFATVPAGLWNLETHLNQIARGVKVYERRVAPSQGQTHLTFELTRGLTDYFEIAGYLVTARRSGSAGDLVGWRLRPRFRLPEQWLPVKVSLSTEVGFPRSDYEENATTLELRPIIERGFGRLQIDLNPVLGKALRGPGAAEGWDFEPGVRVAYSTSPRVDLSLEYYGSTGPLDAPLPRTEQVHQFFPGADLQLTDAIVWNVGVGIGATSAGNTLVYKTRLGWLFGGKSSGAP
jgi:hypothetical protein